ncbi:MAG: translocation/assembly module TamB domain-containing protein [Cyanobacteria bacterium Co-bin8]|nr:translocation/assembly module TamB domain-containing protein [Cyanobacteria bacterium Co-bin8]
MTNPQQSEPERPTRRRRRRRLIKVGLTLGSVLVLTGAGAAWWGWIFLNERFSPWASAELSKALKRPVNVGEIEGLTFSGIRVGPSSIPPIPTETDSLALESVEVRFNLLDLLRRELNLDVVLENAEGYFEQNAELEWIDVDFETLQPERDREPIIEVKPGTIGLRDSRLTLTPYSEPDLPRVTVRLQNVQADVDFIAPEVEVRAGGGAPEVQAQQIDFDATADSAVRGSLAIAGSILLPPAPEDGDTSLLPPDLPRPLVQISSWIERFDQVGRAWALPSALAQAQNTDEEQNNAEDEYDPTVDRRVRLNIRAQDAQAPEIAAIVFSLFEDKPPITITKGDVSGNVVIDVLPNERPLVTGTGRVADGAVVVKGLPVPIESITGLGRFQGRSLALDPTSFSFGEVTATAQGLVDFIDGYALTGRVNPFTVAQISELFEFTTPVPVEGAFAATFNLTGPLGNPNVSANLASQGVTTLDRVQLAALGADISFSPEALVIDSFRAVPLEGGELVGSGRYTRGETGILTLTAQGRDLPGDALGRPYGLPEAITLGPVFLEAGISGPIDRLQGAASWRAPAGDYPARGDIAIAGNTLRFTDTFVQVGGGTISGDGVLANRVWNASLQARGIQVGRFTPRLDGVVSGSFDLAGDLRTPGLENIQGQGDAVVALTGGTLIGTAALSGGNWNTAFQARDVQLNQFLPAATGTASGDFQLAGSLADLSPEGIRGQGDAVFALAGGSVTGQGQLSNGAWNATVQGSNVQLGQFSPTLQGTAGGQFALSGDLNNLTLAGIRGQGDLQLSDGLATAAPRFPQLAAVQEPLIGTVAWNGSQLQIQEARSAGLLISGTVTPQLTGPGTPTLGSIDLALQAREFNLAALPVPNQVPVSGLASFDGRLSGSLANLNLVGDARLADLAVSNLRFEPLLAGPVAWSTAQGGDINLQGTQDTLQVTYADNRNLSFNIRAGESVAFGGVENSILRADVQQFPLDILNLPPGGIAGLGTVRGTVQTATVTGNLDQATLSGNVDISNLSLGYISLDRFRGQLAYADETLALTGGRFQVEEGEYLVTGRFSQRGEPQLVAEVTAQNAEIQDILTTLQFFELADFERGLRSPDWFRAYTPEEIATALPTSPTGDTTAPLWEQLRRLSELLELEDIIATQEEASPLPPLEELAGKFSGNLSISGSLPADFTVGFDLAGQNWTWGNTYQVDQILATGRYADGVLRLDPARFASNVATNEGELTPASLTLSGEIGLNAQDQTPRTLSAIAQNVPLSSLRQPLRLPTSIEGRLNADTALTGSLANPQLRGVLSLADATINNNPVQSAQARFIYQDARLNLESALVVDNPEDPLTLVASVPYRLPFAQQQALSPDLAIDINVRDEGIGLLNLFSREVAWESGQGTVNLTVRGRWGDGQAVPEIQTLAGFATLEEATVRAQILPEPLTNLNGQVRFEGDRIIVDQLAGQFSQGEVIARGALPLLNPIVSNFPAPIEGAELTPVEFPTAADVSDVPLTVDAQNVRLNFKGIYDGRVDGRIQVGGSVFLFGTLINGPVVLSEGQLSLPDPTVADATTIAQTTATRTTQGNFQLPPPAFDDLELLLAENVRIAVGGVVDVAAEGGVTINGIFPAVRPEGRIRLPSGRISLVTTSFRLTGDDNYAEFRPNLGLDPYLRATLQTAVPASSGNTTLVQSSPFPRNEVPDFQGNRLGLNQGGIETVRIQAQVDGPASQVAQLRGVTLTSTPTRSEGEIVTLISGGFLTALESTLGSVGGTGDGFQGLIALAGTALLNNVQDLLGTALNLTELRLFSTTPPGGQGTGTALDFGGEVGFALSPTISLSVQKVFTNVTPAQFNVRYRINDQFLLRGTTSYENFRENSGLLLEYESRF